MPRPCFHLSIPAVDLLLSRHWYERVLGCVAGRCSEAAVILDLAGHQLVLQRQPQHDPGEQIGIYPRHFGLVFETAEPWQNLRERIEASDEPFAVAPKWRYFGTELEHASFFLKDPGGNWLEFKHYRQPEAVLGCRELSCVGDPEWRR